MVVLLSIAMTGITKMVITTMDSQQKIDAEFRAQQDARQVEYDMEKILGEAKRLDAASHQYAEFRDDYVSVPNQNGGWTTYYYATPPGAIGPTIVRLITSSKPVYAPTLRTSDKQMINVMPNASNQSTTVERINSGPIFTYYKSDGTQATFSGGKVQTPRDVRSILVNYRITVSEGHTLKEPVNASTRINLRNY